MSNEKSMRPTGCGSLPSIICLIGLFAAGIQTAVAVEYNDGVAAYNSRDYAGAIALFQQLLTEDPTPGLEDNIHFWLGEAHFARGELLPALASFERVFAVPAANKRTDALIKIAICYQQLGMTDAGCAVLSSLDRLHRESSALAKRDRVRQRLCNQTYTE